MVKSHNAIVRFPVILLCRVERTHKLPSHEKNDPRRRRDIGPRRHWKFWWSNDGVRFGLGAVAIKNEPCNESITDQDFESVFDRKDGEMAMERRGTHSEKPSRRIYCQTALRQEYELEIEEWMQNG